MTMMVVFGCKKMGTGRHLSSRLFRKCFYLRCGVFTPRFVRNILSETLLTVPISGSNILGQGCLIKWARVIE